MGRVAPCLKGATEEKSTVAKGRNERACKLQCSAATVWWRYWLKLGEGEVELVMVVNVVKHEKVGNICADMRVSLFELVTTCQSPSFWRSERFGELGEFFYKHF